MAPLPSMIATGNLKEILGDIDTSELAESAMTRARVMFVSNFPQDAWLTWEDTMYRVQQPIIARVNTDGDIVSDNDDEDPVLLLANDDGLNIRNLQWQIRVDLPANVIPSLPAAQMRAFWFNAGVDGETLDMKTVAPAVAGSVVSVIQGPAGEGLHIDGIAATYGALPGSAANGDAWLVTADGKLYVRSVGAWPANGAGVPVQGPQGDPGDPGAPGTDGADGVDGVDGADGQPQGMYATTIGSGVATTFTITHNLGTQDLIIGFRLTATGEVVDVDPITHIDVNSFSVTFAVAPAVGAVRVIVIGGAMAVVAGDIDGGSL